MIYSIKTITHWGIEWRLITVEIDSNKSLPWIDIIGLPDSTVKESRERLRSTFRSCNIEIPPHRYVINLSPSDIKKSGAAFDVPIAAWLLMHILWDEVKNKDIVEKSIFLWELGLDGIVKKVNGILSVVISAKKEWYNHFFIPVENKDEIECVSDITIYPLSHFNDILSFLWNGISFWYQSSWKILYDQKEEKYVDFADIQWHN